MRDDLTCTANSLYFGVLHDERLVGFAGVILGRAEQPVERILPPPLEVAHSFDRNCVGRQPRYRRSTVQMSAEEGAVPAVDRRGELVWRLPEHHLAIEPVARGRRETVPLLHPGRREPRVSEEAARSGEPRPGLPATKVEFMYRLMQALGGSGRKT